MAGWFSRIIKGGERAGADPVDFALTCRCGQMVTGLRGKRMHVAVCRECGFQICVLPISPYPRPKVRAPKKKVDKPPPLPKRKSPTADDDSGIRTPPPIPKRSGRPSKTSSRKLAGAPGARTKEPRETPSHDEPAWQTSPRKLITPFRMTVLGMIAVVTLAGWIVVRQRAKNLAVVTVAESVKAARTALASSQFDQADQQFSRAVQALDLLGRDDREARVVRQQAREAAAANKLASISLFEFLSEARQTQNMTGKDWQRVFKRSYLGDWFLLDSNALKFPSDDIRQLAFTVQLVPGANPVQVRGDLSKWSKQFAAGERPKHFVLAGQLEDVRGLPDGKGWEIVLQSDTLFPWADAGTYAAIGGTTDDETTATLKSQAKLLGVSE